jgi:hypothetical protein
MRATQLTQSIPICNLVSNDSIWVLNESRNEFCMGHQKNLDFLSGHPETLMRSINP